MDQKRIDEIMQSAQKEMEQAQIVFDALQKQRHGALHELEKKTQKLLENTGKLTKPKLEGEEGPKILANTLRELVTAVNSTHLVLEAHDKFIDMLVQDVKGAIDQVQGQAMLHMSVMSEVMMQTLLSKNVFTEEELKETHKEVAAATQQRLNQARQAESEGETLKV